MEYHVRISDNNIIKFFEYIKDFVDSNGNIDTKVYFSQELVKTFTRKTLYKEMAKITLKLKNKEQKQYVDLILKKEETQYALMQIGIGALSAKRKMVKVNNESDRKIYVDIG